MMTIEQARQYLSREDNVRYSDEDVQSIINDSYTLADIAIDQYLEEKKRDKRKSN